jgi:hypothetical protein
VLEIQKIIPLGKDELMRIWKGIALFGLTALLLVSFTDDALAQRRGGGPPPGVPAGFKPHLELSATYGSMWGGNIDFSYGFTYAKIRTGTGPSVGIALDYNIHPMQAIELSYTYQDGSLDLDYQGLRTLTPMSVNVWHIGSIRMLAPGKVQPFVLGSLGATFFSPGQASFLLDETDPNSIIYTQSTTKFSINFGLGLKAYFGKAERIGIRATFKVMPTLYNTGAGLWFGTGGGGATITGNAIWQYEGAIGLTVKFGS